MILSYYMSTVTHSGTHTATQILKPARIKFRHCCPKAVDEARDSGLPVVTTSRDPYRVAASWANKHPEVLKNGWPGWREQWAAWEQIKQMAVVIFYMENIPFKECAGLDTLGLHAALDQGNFDRYHEVVPRGLFDG